IQVDTVQDLHFFRAALVGLGDVAEGDKGAHGCSSAVTVGFWMVGAWVESGARGVSGFWLWLQMAATPNLPLLLLSPSLAQSAGEGWGGVALAVAPAVALALPGSLPQRRSWQTRPRTGRRTRMCVVFRRDRDVSSKNPASG